MAEARLQRAFASAEPATSEPDMPWRWRRALLLTALLYAPFVGLHALCLFGVGWRTTGVELWVFAPMVALLGLVPTSIRLLSRRTRAKAWRTLASCLLVLLGFVAAMHVVGRLRHFAFVLAAR